jgi:predicted alpha/beta-fold hydrolase
MNTQLIESLVETIRVLSPAEQTILWQKLDHSPTTENILLQKIAQTLPTAIQQRYNDLRAKLQAETLTPAEHQELLNLTDTIEQFDADRLQHLLELAQLRQISLPELLDRSGVKNIRRLLMMANLHPPT